MSSNNKTEWGQIKARPVEEDLLNNNGCRSPYAGLIAEIFLRLKKTPPNEMLDIPFVDRETAVKAKTAIRSWFEKRKGAGYVRFGIDAPNEVGGASLLVARGPNYSKSVAPGKTQTFRHPKDGDEDEFEGAAR